MTGSATLEYSPVHDINPGLTNYVDGYYLWHDDSRLRLGTIETEEGGLFILESGKGFDQSQESKRFGPMDTLYRFVKNRALIGHNPLAQFIGFGYIPNPDDARVDGFVTLPTIDFMNTRLSRIYEGESNPTPPLIHEPVVTRTSEIDREIYSNFFAEGHAAIATEYSHSAAFVESIGALALGVSRIDHPWAEFLIHCASKIVGTEGLVETNPDDLDKPYRGTRPCFEVNSFYLTVTNFSKFLGSLGTSRVDNGHQVVPRRELNRIKGYSRRDKLEALIPRSLDLSQRQQQKMITNLLKGLAKHQRWLEQRAADELLKNPA